MPQVVEVPSLLWDFPNPTWSPYRLKLVCHYFSKLTWLHPEEPRQRCITLLELMLDMFVPLQTYGLVNILGEKTRIKIELPPGVPPGEKAYYYLPAPSGQQQLPLLLLTQASHAWLLTLKYLDTKSEIIPCRLEAASLNLNGYSLS